jgi:thiamine biosynthesis lipoprotein
VSAEASRSFACFGGTATVHVRGMSSADGEKSAERAQSYLLDAHRRLSRFIPDSELTRLNCDPRRVVPATPLMRSLAAAVATAGERSGGLVDATLLGSLERAGYRHSLGDHPSLPLSESLAGHVERAPGKPHPSRRWSSVDVDHDAGTIVRPPRVKIDSGGIAKGLLADQVAATLREQRTYAVDCCGDISIGGSAGLERTVLVDDPFGAGPIHELTLREGAVATSGIGRRCWIGEDGRATHHILDPRTGHSAFTGIVQVSALAPTALLAEVYAKAALLSGPDRAAEWLPHGGVFVHDSGEAVVVAGDRPLSQAPARS